MKGEFRGSARPRFRHSVNHFEEHSSDQPQKPSWKGRPARQGGPGGKDARKQSWAQNSEDGGQCGHEGVWHNDGTSKPEESGPGFKLGAEQKRSLKSQQLAWSVTNPNQDAEPGAHSLSTKRGVVAWCSMSLHSSEETSAILGVNGDYSTFPRAPGTD